MASKDNKWKEKFQDFLGVCQDELKKTTAIGMRMLSASKTNTQLRESFSDLGQLTYEALKSGELKWDNSKVVELLEIIEKCETELKSIEEEVQKIKQTTGSDQRPASEDSGD